MTQWSCKERANRPIYSIIPGEQRNSLEQCHVLPLKKLTQHHPKQVGTHYFSRKRGSCFSMSSGKLLYHQKQGYFELNGIVLCPGMWIETHLMGHWVCGQLNKDATGWYIITSDHMGLRLRSGFLA